ncbi:MAG: hypothetical protein ACRENS_03945, partial [Candidatus Eiseniibacteriota bacterium]
ILNICVAALSLGRRAEAVTIVPAKNASARDTTRGLYALEFGSFFSAPIRAAGASRDEPGFDAGLNFTAMLNSSIGVGVDVAYHYWPVSTAFKDTFNTSLRDQTLNTLELGGTTWRLNTLQYTGHIKLAAPSYGALSPWLQIGAGLYRVDPNTTGYSGDAGFFTVIVQPLKRTSHFGYNFTTGIDVSTGPRARLGIIGSYNWLNCHDTYNSNLGIFSIGVHALFGR